MTAAHQVEPGPTPRRLRDRWLLIQLLALPAIFCGTTFGFMVVPWSVVYGSWEPEDSMFRGVAVTAHALEAGLAVWLFTWLIPRRRLPRTRLAALVVAVLLAFLVVNVLNLHMVRQDVCRIRESNGNDPRLNSPPWPLAFRCSTP